MTRAKEHRGSAEALTRFQRLAWSNMVFSLTRRCPLRCAHCITSSAPDSTLPMIDLVDAEAWSTEFADLADIGLRTVTFTGGEPLLAMRQLEILVRAAKLGGLRTAVVTSGVWGANPAHTDRIAQRIAPFVDSWDFGYDVFHAKHLDLMPFIVAVRAAADWGGTVAIRMCVDAGGETTEIIRCLEKDIPENVQLILQPTYALGRGGDLEHTGSIDDMTLPCLATGAFVREDGSVGPCCSALGYGARGRHPFEFAASNNRVVLRDAWRRWRQDPLLRLMRLIGLSMPIRWLSEEGILPPRALEAQHVCGLCERLWDRDGRVAATLRRRAAEPAVISQLDRLETALYGEIWTEAKPLDATR